MKQKFGLLILASLLLHSLIAQMPTIKILESGKRVSIRGLSVVSDNIIWASGSNGSVARSTDGGNSFNWIVVPGYEKRDFRDIEAFDENTAIIMGVAEPAIILKTKDGGITWKKVFEDTTKGMFLDAMDFSDEENGIVIGDPINKRFFMASSNNQGESWMPFITPIKLDKKHGDQQSAKEGEAFFASSGTNIKLNGTHPFYVSGGKSSRLFYFSDYNSIELPIVQGKESTGANSVAINYSKDKRIFKGVIVGGDFTKDTISKDNSIVFEIPFRKKVKFNKPSTPPHGYRSCVIYLDDNNLLTCGTSGIDISKDGGMNWELISNESFHVCQKAKKGNAVFLAGANGRIAKLVQ